MRTCAGTQFAHHLEDIVREGRHVPFAIDFPQSSQPCSAHPAGPEKRKPLQRWSDVLLSPVDTRWSHFFAWPTASSGSTGSATRNGVFVGVEDSHSLMGHDWQSSRRAVYM